MHMQTHMERNRINSRNSSPFMVVVLFLFSFVSFSTSNTDHLSLISFKSLITEDPYQALASWNFSRNYCHWRGVTCGDRTHPQRVTSLDLDSLGLAGKISPSLSNLSSLARLSLSDNRLTGGIPEELGRLLRLKKLNLSYNSLEGRIPANLSRCSLLEFVDLGTNLLVGEIPRNLSALTELKLLMLSDNGLRSAIPQELGGLSSLLQLRLAYNHLHGPIPGELGLLKNLTVLNLEVNNLAGEVPPSIYNLSSLMYMSLSSNQLVGTLPPDIGTSLPNLRALSMYGNQFRGPIPPSLPNASGIWYLDLGENMLSGLVPSNLGDLGSLSSLELGGNLLESGEDWGFLASMANCTQLEYVGLSGNRLTGPLPSAVGNLSTRLSTLYLAGNQISGRIPSEIGNLVGLTDLNLEHNFLTGPIPDSLRMISGLGRLYLSQNNLMGEIPPSLANLSRLFDVSFTKNNLSGGIPAGFLKLGQLQKLGISFNNLSGTVLEALDRVSPSLSYLDLSHNSLTGSLPSAIAGMNNLVTLDVSSNQFSGEIDDSFVLKCLVLEHLRMENNCFRGAIPAKLADLKGLRVLDLSSNRFSGPIPELRSLNLTYLNLSFNDLEGRVPANGIFASMGAFSITGNKGLCGGVKELHLPECAASAQQTSDKFRWVLLVVLAPIGVIVGVIIAMLTTKVWLPEFRRNSSVLCLTTENQHRKSRKIREDRYCTRVSYCDLSKATNGFSVENLIGEGSFSSVYKGELVVDGDGDDNCRYEVVAVKVLHLRCQGASKSFVTECDALRNIRHHNLVRVLTSCTGVDHEGNDFKALVFEFMPNGSLDDFLHPQVHDNGKRKKNLDLVQRLNIAIDIASALDYLHLRCSKPVVHCDLKPRNVLLDENMMAHVADFGLARIISKSGSKRMMNSNTSIKVKGTVGYIAPEYGSSGRVSTLGDVYSFGMVLLEMFTGKRPTDEIFEDDYTLHEFAEMYFPDRIENVVDPELVVMVGNKLRGEVDRQMAENHKLERLWECLETIFRIGLLCSKTNPRDRMPIEDVLKVLYAVRAKILGIVAL